MTLNETKKLSALRTTASFAALEQHRRELSALTISELFQSDASRGERMVSRGVGLYLDYSKNRITDETLRLLIALAVERGVAEKRDAMFDGQHINQTENRAVLHVALRMAASCQVHVDGVNVVDEVHGVLKKLNDFAERVRSGAWVGFTGKPIRNVVNIGIGGSDLGPVMAFEALRFYSRRDMNFRFVSNVDSTDLVEALRDFEPSETLFIVASKTFSTLETLTNANSARHWIIDALGSDEAVAQHFVAISTNAEKVKAFGIDVANMFEFWDWVGGRYSLDSAIGLSTMIAIGPDRFGEFLEGFRAIDEHFCAAPFEENLPVLLGVIAVWNRTFLDLPTVGVMPYEQYLKRLPAYLQQLTMESNGKHVTMQGERVDYNTGAIYWGEPGTNGQHSFYQLLHQGTTIVPVDFIGFSRSLNPLGEHHDILMANMLAQARALAFGRSAEELRAAGTPDELVAAKVMDGNRPSTVIIGEELTPRLLGTLIALYEHSVFVQGAIWGIDSFDQWGVELGKELEMEIFPVLESVTEPPLEFDSSTNALIRYYREHRATKESHGDQ
jgi:glucose-6-phosphate isomerase